MKNVGIPQNLTPVFPLTGWQTFPLPMDDPNKLAG